ncbi:hypothetical protein CAOG_01533 [Capsaspora owczarzaki ATCC 30864]|uniref:PH domain-containing protein n=1 Tax=Capsaspora owczarzaki (strain ATCC 30864) TaxID=595528 RepID=A0A0D2WJH1_CAPO3|nr:hypothetical protein CAOG_01533 [Capsaspora owczarzaki ATCC 30864]KJE90190.1 hypothetical protein CAOG_001533 [Capsaspora owczarzaki ATCC 30864]|eukprot:XP_004364401.1 hypothetical protein CAOG_01533 [Capsaspora owczarzaki ATCC 30864]
MSHIMSGWVQREESGLVKSFKRRWCVVQDTAVCVYKDDKDVLLQFEHQQPPLDVLFAEDITSVQPLVSQQGQQFGFEIGTSHGATLALRCSEDEHNEWMAAIRLLTRREKPIAVAGAPVMDFVTIECFTLRGIRVDGSIEPHILAVLSDFDGRPIDPAKRAKKIEDVRGWFCNRFVALPDVLNLMTQHEWQLQSCAAAESQTPTDKAVVQCHRLVFHRPRLPSPAPAPAPATSPTGSASSFPSVKR